MASRFQKYSLWWPTTVDPASMELDMIKSGGQWTKKDGEIAGEGLPYHFKEFIKIVWPWVVFHKWFNLILENYFDHRTIVLIGPASSSKTFTSAVLVLVDYFAHPDETTVICCSTTKERLQDRVWADVTKLFREAKREREWLPGNIIEGRLRIITDSRKDSPDGRDFRNGIVGVAAKRGDTFIGIGEFAGIKNKRVRLLGDELSMLPKSFCDAISNLDKNPDFKCIGLGNPKDTTDALGVLGEPSSKIGGWDSGIDQAFGTKTWETRREQGIAIQLPGDDSPNLDGTLGIPLISQKDIDRDVSFYGKQSVWFTMMDLGVMPRGQGSRRVLTRQLCMKFHAMDEPTWQNTDLTRIAFLDAAYRGVGGDRCVFGELVFGRPVDQTKFSLEQDALVYRNSVEVFGYKIIALVDTKVVPIDLSLGKIPEDQIVDFVKAQCESRGIPPENFFFDSGMRTSLVSAFSRNWSPQVMSIDCGGTPSESNVSADIQIPCNKYYSKLITEMWFSVRLTVESHQFRGLTEDAIMEFSEREWTIVGANKIEVEPKEKMKLKSGRSPDLADAISVGLAGARQRGFVIQRLLPKDDDTPRGPDWRDDLRRRARELNKVGELNYAA